MQQPKSMIAALIGDMVGSRRVSDRSGLQRRVEGVFAEVDRAVGGTLAFTIGDEFQGSYPTLAEAIEASLLLHVRTTTVIDLRIGIGWGELIAVDPERTPFGQDGPCWWRAREAIELVGGSARRRGPELHTAALTGSFVDPMLNHYLLLRDQLIGGLDEVDARILLGLIEGKTQNELASSLGLNKSSVSRRANSHGILALVETRDIGNPPLESRT